MSGCVVSQYSDHQVCIDNCRATKSSMTQGCQRAGSVESVPSLPSDQSNLDGLGVARSPGFFVFEIWIYPQS